MDVASQQQQLAGVLQPVIFLFDGIESPSPAAESMLFFLEFFTMAVVFQQRTASRQNVGNIEKSQLARCTCSCSSTAVQQYSSAVDYDCR